MNCRIQTLQHMPEAKVVDVMEEAHLFHNSSDVSYSQLTATARVMKELLSMMTGQMTSETHQRTLPRQDQFSDHPAFKQYL